MKSKLLSRIGSFLTVVLFLPLFGGNMSYAQGGHKYQVAVPESYISKEYLELATRDFPNRGRYITEQGFVLYTEVAAQEQTIRMVFEGVGIPVLSVWGDKAYIAPLEKAAGNNCGQAQILCSNTSQTANSTGPGIQELNGANQGCLGAEHQSSWYYLNIQSGGTLTMTIDPSNNSDDYDFAIWGPFTEATAAANCPPTSAPIRCSYSAETDQTGMMIPYNGQTSSVGCGPWYWPFDPCYGMITTTNNPVDNSEGAGGDSWVQNLNTLPDQIYILLVDNFSNSGQPYSMSFGGTTVLGCTPVVLPVELSVFSASRTNKGNVLSWTTETEKRADYFLLEWTTNPAADNWIQIAHVGATGDSEVQQHYSMLHEKPVADQVNYYRLTLVDLDGARKVYDYHLVSVNNALPVKSVERIVNMLGQEVGEDAKGIVIYQFSDGTSQKVYK